MPRDINLIQDFEAHVTKQTQRVRHLHCLTMPARAVEILIVEDNEADAYLTLTALRDLRVQINTHVVRDGVAAVQFLKREGDYREAPRPDIVLLDLNLPRTDGHEVLASMKTDPHLRTIPVVVISGSSAPSDLRRAYEGQVAGYIIKPANHDDYFRAIRSLKEFWCHAIEFPPKVEATASEG